MLSENFLDKLRGNAHSLFDKVFNFETIFVFVIALVLAFLLSRLLNWIVVRIAGFVGKAEDAGSPERAIRLRRVETYLSVSLALVRFAIFAIAIVAAWQVTHPETAPAAFVGASTVFIVLAGATIVPMLRDLTSGSIMIAEQWYNVGDYITVLPFAEVDGVVERMNLRSTKIRSLNGEVVWIHNQHIQGIKVTPKGVRTIAVDVFVNNLDKGKSMIEHVAQTLPVSPTMLASPFELVNSHKLRDDLWQMTAIAQTAPGREWLIEGFAIEAMEEYDKKDGKIIVHGPIARTADEIAERRFRRAMRMKAPVMPDTDPAQPHKRDGSTSKSKTKS